jgi:hypothetical protein
MGIRILHVSAAVYAHNVEGFSIGGGRRGARETLHESQGKVQSQYKHAYLPQALPQPI